MVVDAFTFSVKWKVQKFTFTTFRAKKANSIRILDVIVQQMEKVMVVTFEMFQVHFDL